ncbi:MAG: Ubiquinone/menaquinone biosynthesis C-methyltransferase UbiE [Pseudomonas sp.]|nr:MAG: Ubiquinone/menaquinone biosynthesis C-methyltransferase UbiE [Pseudomonas sp.]
MLPSPLSTLEIEFAERVGREHARTCGNARPSGVLQRIAVRREMRLVRRALKAAGEPGLILDLACGAGRFWPVLAEHGNRVILASDNSQAMLDHAGSHHSAALLARIKIFQGSAFAIELPANAVDCIFCLELFRHVPTVEGRLALLAEFQRVSRDTVIVSVNSQHRMTVESEFRQAGFKVLRHQEFLPGSAMWCVYVLRKRG